MVMRTSKEKYEEILRKLPLNYRSPSVGVGIARLLDSSSTGHGEREWHRKKSGRHFVGTYGGRDFYVDFSLSGNCVLAGDYAFFLRDL